METTCQCCERNQEKRPHWKPGPWKDEPDFVPAFEHAGLLCLLHRNGHGSWCGYVGVPPSHPHHGKDYDSVDCDVHGGLTYAEKCTGHVCHVPKAGETDDIWWFGFDCNHFQDACPDQSIFGPDFEYPLHYWTLKEAKTETVQLAEQLAKAT